ncbi:uncharacterized protein LOC143378728 [Andrena cerasifolii]|uniref:uncharacterized protein LOC143378728 n=1 Tax=Andrena cerasifolii TaxID=2819439 RepID=UPI004038062C
MGDENYDDLRRRNIAERNAVFAEFFTDLKKETNEAKSIEKYTREEDTENLENEPPKKRRRIHFSFTDDESVTFKRLHTVSKRYNTRSRSKNLGNEDSNPSNDGEDEENEAKSKRHRLRVMFPWAKPQDRSIDLMKMKSDKDQEEGDEDENNDDSFEELQKKKNFNVNKSVYDPNSIPSVEEITQDMMDNVAERSTMKQYCKIRGTSCHQCRQKTMDTKTVCRSGECIGVRGQFCGPCLKGRYGEAAIEALKDPNWACPPCRGLCNCSICRTRSGLRPTGILAPVAQEEGYSSVMDYLQSTELDNT